MSVVLWGADLRRRQSRVIDGLSFRMTQTPLTGTSRPIYMKLREHILHDVYADIDSTGFTPFSFVPFGGREKYYAGRDGSADRTYSAVMRPTMFSSRGWTVLASFYEAIMTYKEVDERDETKRVGEIGAAVLPLSPCRARLGIVNVHI